MCKKILLTAFSLLVFSLPTLHSEAQLTTLEDFEDGELTTPHEWTKLETGAASASITAAAGGYAPSDFCALGTFSNGLNGDQAIFAGLNFFAAFDSTSEGIVFWAKGEGIWDLELITTDITPGPHSIPYLRFRLDSTWKAFYFPWTDFAYPIRALNRPALNPHNIHTLWFTPQSNQGGKDGWIRLDNLGYFDPASPSALDVDGDGIPDSDDYDADNDNWPNALESSAASDYRDPASHPKPELGLPGGCSYKGLFPIGGWTDEFSDFEELTGMQSALVAIFQSGWGNAAGFFHFDKARCDYIARYGAVPVYQWPILNADNEGASSWPVIQDTLYRLQDIIEGKLDDDLTMFANEVKAWAKPLFLNPVVEYNQGWTSYHAVSNFGPDGKQMPPPSQLGLFDGTYIADSLMAYCDTIPADSMSNYYGDPNIPDGPERMRDALLHIRDLFENVGATNVIWTMQAHPIVDPAHFGAWTALSNYYHEDYVDWHSASAHHGVRNDTVRFLSEIITPMYDTLMGLDSSKGILLIEFAVHTNDSGTQDMSAVFDDDFGLQLRDSFPMVKGWTYANSDNYGTNFLTASLQIDEDRFPGEIAAFQSVGQDLCFSGRPILPSIITAAEEAFEESAPLQALLCYPNPSKGALTIEYQGKEKGIATLEICNALGQRIYRMEGNLAQKFRLNSGKLKPGYHFARLTKGANVLGYTKIFVE